MNYRSVDNYILISTDKLLIVKDIKFNNLSVRAQSRTKEHVK